MTEDEGDHLTNLRYGVVFILGYYWLSGAIGVFFVLKWMDLADDFINLLSPFEVYAQMFLAVISLLASAAVLGMVAWLIALNPRIVTDFTDQTQSEIQREEQ